MEAEVGQVADEAGQELAPASAGAESEVERALEPEHEERASLSEKERQNEAVNERDNCSASSVSSSSSTLEREDKEDKLSRDKGTGKEAPAQGTQRRAPGSLASELTCWPSSLPRRCPVSGGGCVSALSQPAAPTMGSLPLPCSCTITFQLGKGHEGLLLRNEPQQRNSSASF